MAAERQDLVCVISCEHATYHIPTEFSALFPDADVLKSHRGWDAGAAGLARRLARDLLQQTDTGPFYAEVSRLLADANRSAHNYRVHSPAVRALPKPARTAILEAWHQPHQQRVAAAVEAQLNAGHRVLHIGCHSFTPALDGVVRNADIGLQYDPKHSGEQGFSIAWQSALMAITTLRVRRNYPYTGFADGLTTLLRRRFGERYIGIELELNQALLEHGAFPTKIMNAVSVSLQKTLQ